jgi:hypothetical protein
MFLLGSIFFDFNLPNATTWFYFSLLLAIALFFKFTRLLSVRNWDVITLFLIVPGLLLLQEANSVSDPGHSGPTLSGGSVSLANQALPLPPATILWFGYLWLLCGSAYFLVRSLVDLVLVRRPALAPNLNSGGLAWLGLALFVCLTVVAVRRPNVPTATVGRPSEFVIILKDRTELLAKQGHPVHRLSDNDTAFLAECTSVMICHLAIVVGLVVIGWRHFQDVLSGMAMATFYLLLPYTAFLVDQLHHVLPAALLVWAFAAYRMPTLAGFLLGLAAGTGYFPILTFPAWLGFYWKRGAGRFTLAFAAAFGICLLTLGLFMWLNGELAQRVQDTLRQSDWQPWKPVVETDGFWKGIQWAGAYRLPVFIAYLAFVVMTLFWPRPKNLAHLLALSCAVILGIQFWYADRGGVYVLWYLPLLLLLVFRPNLADREPTPIVGESDWLARARRALMRFSSRLLKLPEPTARVH